MDLFLKSALKGQKYTKLPLKREGSERHYIRIKTENFSWILACSTKKQLECFLLKQSAFFKAGLNVPKIKAHDFQKGLLLLEDLGSQSLEKEFLEDKKNTAFSYYFQALDQIIKLQKKGTKAFPSEVNVPALSHSADNSAFNGWSVFTKEKFFREMLWTERYLIKNFFNFEPQKELRFYYLREWKTLCERLGSFPVAPAHRDYHSRNIFLPHKAKNNITNSSDPVLSEKNSKNIYMIDFQDAGLFPRFYDPISLLYDIYVNSKMENKDREKLLSYFILKSSLSQKGLTETLKEEISITAIQRLFKACGSFAGFFILKKQESHLKYIFPTLKLLREQLKKTKQFPYFLSLLSGLNTFSRENQTKSFGFPPENR